MPIQGLQNSQKNVSSYGVISYRSGMSWLSTEGKWIVDSEGNIVILRGANFMGYEFGSWGSHIEEDYAKMASWGFNVVRLPIAWHHIEKSSGVYDESYFTNYVDRDIAWAKKYGIYIILDMHQWYWSPRFTFFSDKGETGNGVPVWMVNGYENSREGMNQAITDFWLGKGPNGTSPSEPNPSMQDRFIAVWKYVATRYSNETTIVYELFNEPPRGTLTTQEAASYLNPFYNKLIDQIRTIDSNHILFYEPIGGYSTSTAQLLNKLNMAFSFHFYELRNNYSGNVEDLLKEWKKKYDFVKDWSIPISVGEFGAYSGVINALLWINDTLSIFNENRLSWMWWTYYKSDTSTDCLCYRNGTERVELIQYLKQMK
jgi:hypothetical protein